MTGTLMDIVRLNEEAIFAETVKRVKAESEHYAAVPDEQLRASLAAFLEGLKELWEAGLDDRLRAYAQRVSRQRVPAGFRISEIQRGFGTLKEVVWTYLEREQASDLPGFFDAFHQLDMAFATFIYAFSDAYAKTQAEEISKLQAERLEASEEKYRAIFGAARDGFFIINMEGDYIDVNPAAGEMVGYTRDELLTMNTMELVPPEYPRRPLADRQATWRRGGRMEIPLMTKASGRVPVDMTFGVIQYHGREAVVSVCRDISERQRMEEQLKANQAELEEKVRMLETQQAAIRELSTPVIQVWEGILVLPLVGAVDSARVRQIMESLLARIVETQSEIVILDITGVPMVDTAVANHLIKTVQAARMLGARSIVTGLSPKVAQTVVELGVELTGITTCANLRAGLEMALGVLGARVEA